jgi:hypothetical protein
VRFHRCAGVCRGRGAILQGALVLLRLAVGWSAFVCG